MDNCQRGPVGLRDNTKPQVMGMELTNFVEERNKLVLEFEGRKQYLIALHYKTLETHYKDEMDFANISIAAHARRNAEAGKVYKEKSQVFKKELP